MLTEFYHWGALPARSAINGAGRRKLFLMSAILAAFVLAAAASARAETALVHVFVNQTQESGQRWAGCPDLIIGLAILKCGNEAPSAVLCVFDASGQRSCLEPNRQTEALRSPCPKSFDCDFRHVALPVGLVFGVLVVSPSLLDTKLVDAVVFTRGPTDEDDQRVLRMDRI